ncbi:bifunctional riboflavin kinase/FAD synthetase [Psychroflexus halocasei]|uniref:Riboflavin biosynthesis protein n=1 Tax=Psychroflexus halocasei TaxID=908615 RepID=A0A1H3VQ37_9FLAO|nr:bifunctional riboflavin kinase/FAD synthetase [Psychroflexus halocasei]SDZ76880.1 riboflavin kinase / FMN adenylyltransferase [Psychroflexus halocasei]
MKIIHHISEFDSSEQTIVTIGTFDGVHVGHRKIIKRLINAANQTNSKSTLLTFFPHPRMVLQQNSDLKLINTLEEKKKILAQTDLDNLIIQPFTLEFSRLRAENYVKDILVDQLNAKKIIIGYDHRFGRNRTANIDDLRDFGKKYNFSVEEISKQDIDEVAVSSTKIRNALNQGDIELANSYLTQAFQLTGEIVRGKGLGKELGYPTANLKIKEDYKLIPREGVYVVQSEIDEKPYFGLMNIGTNPTFNEVKQSVETYFFDLNKDLYGQHISIKLLKRLRGEQKFDGPNQLIEAMNKDKEQALNYIDMLKDA